MPHRYSFVLKDEGAAAQLGILYDFFTALPFWQMQPWTGVAGETAVAVAKPGEAYAVYLPSGGKASLDLRAVASSLVGRWFSPARRTVGRPI